MILEGIHEEVIKKVISMILRLEFLQIEVLAANIFLIVLQRRLSEHTTVQSGRTAHIGALFKLCTILTTVCIPRHLLIVSRRTLVIECLCGALLRNLLR